MRDAIPPSQRLSITVRYLATGNTFEDLKFTSAISPQSTDIIITVFVPCTYKITQLSIPTHCQLRHRLKFIKNHLKNSYMFRSSTIFRELQCPS